MLYLDPISTCHYLKAGAGIVAERAQELVEEPPRGGKEVTAKILSKRSDANKSW